MGVKLTRTYQVQVGRSVQFSSFRRIASVPGTDTHGRLPTQANAHLAEPCPLRLQARLSRCRHQPDVKLVTVPRWNASSLTFSVRSMCAKACAIES